MKYSDPMTRVLKTLARPVFCPITANPPRGGSQGLLGVQTFSGTFDFLQQYGTSLAGILAA